MPLPFQLDHINLWLVDEGDGWTVVDTGIGNAATRALWDKLLEGKKVKRVLVTHYHPDHAGNAAWLCQRHGVELWMTQGEYLTAHAVRTSGAGYTTDAVLAGGGTRLLSGTESDLAALVRMFAPHDARAAAAA